MDLTNSTSELHRALCMASYGAETWTLRKLDQKYMGSFEMWCWRRMEKIIWTDLVNNEAVLHIVKEERNILHTIRRRKANWIGHILRRNCLLKHIIEGKIIGTRRWGRRRKQLLDDLKEQENTGSWRRKLRIALFGKLSLEEAMDLSQDRLLFDLIP
jgi:hypothetical protein